MYTFTGKNAYLQQKSWCISSHVFTAKPEGAFTNLFYNKLRRFIGLNGRNGLLIRLKQSLPFASRQVGLATSVSKP